MDKKEFIRLFSKEEILGVLFETFEFRHDFCSLASEMCIGLYSQKSQRLIEKAEQLNVKSEHADLQEWIKCHREWEKINKKLDKLGKQFEQLDRR